MKKRISIVVPMYNEHEMVSLFFVRIGVVISQCPQYDFEIVAVNDGSKDDTLELLKAQQAQDPKHISIVSLSRNFGHEPAVCAGLAKARGDAIIVMDCDMQDPPEVIIAMLERYEEGYEVVNGRRASRKEDSLMKRVTAKEFYRLCDRLSGKVRIPQNVGHFRLISRRVADEVLKLSEKNRVFRVEVPYVGFKTTDVPFERAKRAEGKSKYNYRSMSKLAIDAFTSSTNRPLSWPLWWGGILGSLSLLSYLVELVLYCLQVTNTVSLGITGYDWWLILNSLAFFTAIVLVAIGVIGIYLSRMYLDIQNRPFYIIDEYLESEEK